MKFSVLIAHYNNAILFKDCYDSLLSQTYPDWEAIIVDDASSENEREMVKSIIAGDDRFKFFENEKNSGVGVTKSRLIELANGEICGFVDPDDAILPTAIESAMNLFKHKKKVVLAYSRFMACDKKLTPIAPFKSAMQVRNRDPYFFNYPIQIGHFTTFRKDVYLQTEKMNPELRIAEDQDLYLKMYEKGDVHFINETNYYYRAHAGGISQNNNKGKSYDYFAQVVFSTMKRRKLTTINGKKIPETYSNHKEIFALLEYQNGIWYRIKKKIAITLQKLFR
ncbi:glycosyl transferase family 2 [Chryseobacterium lactis]|uniref:Glycosyl transferase family 2 n=1 Tax=Chryseobacterium lactis TaxID=1241981 RepID=A0A3G6RQX7_CHRLC|nr:glycosyltransferase family A protein [Chryseobacterium lactis]AZA81710.1 glycosyltransferase family 2 protein [Chryseobacterium lactis]AZB06708.1 glycosyltransferase family 2 protein [Chryseobacterium lactis]PNW15559.1 glycosyl transferase family 2 [Chryseobacterium lactis]